MNRRTRLWLAAGLALASAVLTVWTYAQLRPDQRAVVMVIRTIEPFSVLQFAQVQAISVDAATADRLFPDAYTAADQVAGLITTRRLRPGEVLRQSDPGTVSPAQVPAVLAAGDWPLSALIPAGARAVSVQVRHYKAAPGDYIQLFRMEQSGAEPVLSQPLLVLAAGSGSVTVLVPAESEVGKILSAQNGGPLEAVLAPIPDLSPAGST